MNKKQITELIKKAKSGDKDAMQKLCLHYDKQINSIIDFFTKNYKLGILNKDDIRQDCYIGIIKSLDKDKNFSRDYFWRMFNEVQRDYDNHCTTIRIPSLSAYNKKQLKIKNELIDSVNCENIREYSNVSDNIDFSSDIVHNIASKQLIQDMKTILTEKQFNILYLYYCEELTLQEIGKIYNNQLENIRAQRNRALSKLHRRYHHFHFWFPKPHSSSTIYYEQYKDIISEYDGK